MRLRIVIRRRRLFSTRPPPDIPPELPHRFTVVASRDREVALVDVGPAELLWAGEQLRVLAPAHHHCLQSRGSSGTPKVRHVMRVSTLQDSRGSQVLLLVLLKKVAAETAVSLVVLGDRAGRMRILIVKGELLSDSGEGALDGPCGERLSERCNAEVDSDAALWSAASRSYRWIMVAMRDRRCQVASRVLARVGQLVNTRLPTLVFPIRRFVIVNRALIDVVVGLENIVTHLLNHPGGDLFLERSLLLAFGVRRWVKFYANIAACYRRAPCSSSNSIEALIEYHKEIHCVDIAASTYNWLEKKLHVEELHGIFRQAIHKFVYRTNTISLEGLEEEGSGELLCGKSEEVKNNIMNLFLPILPPTPKVVGVIKPRTPLPTPTLCPHQQTVQTIPPWANVRMTCSLNSCPPLSGWS
ncbi:hypothetical protein V496_01440 [Pseudogymnoascus sp. VKM F-4515 (FW-2607)]|nr:hypothetical protein V496_01440 [Pseudogymnoascus sp. VKM F-4515 (FW-2607)]